MKVHCPITCKNNANGLCTLDEITINIDGCLSYQEEKLTIGTYENNMFTWNTDYDHDFLDNPDFVASLDENFIHDETGLYFLGTEDEYHAVIEKAIENWEG